MKTLEEYKYIIKETHPNAPFGDVTELEWELMHEKYCKKYKKGEDEFSNEDLHRENDELTLLWMRLFQSLDCGSNSCRFADYPNKVQSGMRTNGSCGCIQNYQDRSLTIDIVRLFNKIKKM